MNCIQKSWFQTLIYIHIYYILYIQHYHIYTHIIFSIIIFIHILYLASSYVYKYYIQNHHIYTHIIFRNITFIHILYLETSYLYTYYIQNHPIYTHIVFRIIIFIDILYLYLEIHHIIRFRWSVMCQLTFILDHLPISSSQYFLFLTHFKHVFSKYLHDSKNITTSLSHLVRKLLEGSPDL